MIDCKNCKMTDEYCASGDCPTSQSPRNNLATKPQAVDLTEKWKRGELPTGYYYIELIRGEHHIDLYKNYDNEWVDCYNNIIAKVLAPVPSYDEWEKICIDNTDLRQTRYVLDCAVTELREEIYDLKERNESLNNRDINLCRIANGIRDENYELKVRLDDKTAECDKVKQQLAIAVEALDKVATYMTCDEVEIREIQPNFCADQAALDTVNEAMDKIRELEK